MRKNVAITKIMTKDPVTVHEGESISRVRELFIEHGFHHLPVVKGKQLVGIISWTDLMRLSFGDAFGQSEKSVDVTLDHTFSIADVMEENPHSISSNHSVLDAAKILSESDFHALPIVTGSELVGIVTTQDLLKFLISLY